MRRIYPALVFIPLFYIIVRHVAPLAFFLFVAIGSGIGQYEFYRLHYRSRMIPSILLGMGLGFFLQWIFYRGYDATPLTAIVPLLLMSVMLFHLFFIRDLQRVLTDSAVIFFGVVYVGWLLGHLILLREIAQGASFVFFLVLVTWGGDAGAYYTGISLGRHPLSPLISPHKTIEGSIGGLLCSIAVAFLSRILFLPVLSWGDCVLLGILLGVLGQLGDLSESMLKRNAGVKDSGSLIPAHGGILDKVDSLIFTAPTLYYYLLLVKGYGRFNIHVG